MFGVKHFVLQILLIWSIVNLILVETSRQKKDVHHMIILNENARPTKSHSLRHKHHVHSTGRTKKKPYKLNKYQDSASFEESSEEISHEDPPTHKPKSKRQSHKHNHHHKGRKHKNHKDNHKNQSHRYKNDNRIHPESHPFSDGKWTPMTSQEFFGTSQQQQHQIPSAFPGPYQSGAMHFSQSVPMEITTPFSLPSNSFFSYESTLNPQMPRTIPQSPLIGTVETYKPFDYSILEKKPQNAGPKTFPTQEAASSNHKVHLTEANPGTPFSIIVDNFDESKKINKQEKAKKINDDTSNKHKKKNKDTRTRGISRFRVRRKTGN